MSFTLRSLPSSVMVTVCSLGAVPALYFVLSGFIFHVPTKGSAANSVAANPRSTNRDFVYRMKCLLKVVKSLSPEARVFQEKISPSGARIFEHADVIQVAILLGVIQAVTD